MTKEDKRRLCERCFNTGQLECHHDETDFPFGPIPHWIKCEEKLPDSEIHVLVFDGEFENVGFSSKDLNIWNCMQWGLVDSITHWMSLPEPPHDP